MRSAPVQSSPSPGQRRQDHHHHHHRKAPGGRRAAPSTWGATSAARCCATRRTSRPDGPGGAGAQLLPADDHGPQPPHRRHDQSVSQPPGRPQELRRSISLPRRISLHTRRPGILPSSTPTMRITGRCAAKAPGRVRWFSRQKEVTDGVFLRGTSICLPGRAGRAGGAGHQRHQAPRRPQHRELHGRHRRRGRDGPRRGHPGLRPHALAAWSTGSSWSGSWTASGGTTTPSPPAPAAPSPACASFPEKVILIAGGKDKGISYDAIGPEINEHVKALILCGATAGVIRAGRGEGRQLHRPAHHGGGQLPQPRWTWPVRRPEPGDVVLLSPASTSFDRFANFMERGRVFKDLVNALK